MHYSPTLSGRNRLSSSFAFSTVAAVVVTAVLISALLYWSTLRVDEAALAREEQIVETVLAQSIEALGHDQESVTVWDDTIRQLQAPDLDLDWMDGNVGIWLYDYFGHDDVFVLNGRDEPVYAMEQGERRDPARQALVADAIDPLVHDLRRRQASGESPAGRDLSLGAADFTVVRDRPAIVSVKPVISDSGTLEQEAGTEPVHISVRFLDGDFLPSLFRKYLVTGGRFSWTDDLEPGERSHPFIARDGRVVGYFVWRPHAPGATVLRQLAPALAGAMGLIGIVLALLVRRVRRGARKLQASEAEARHLASHDTLTGLPNRSLLEAQLDHAVARVRRDSGARFALLYLDLDRFKEVNDTRGHPAGDELLKDVASRLREIVRASDTVARIGGDEFAIIQTDIASQDDAKALAGRAIEELSAVYTLSEAVAFIGVSVGIALAPEDAADRIELSRKADIALYHAKATGRGRYTFFAETMDDAQVRERRAVERELRAALQTGGQLEVQYQPLYDAQSRTLTGVEALLRWRHPLKGYLPPSGFVPIAEETGLIEPLGEWVLAEACAAAAGWAGVKLTVNVSSVQLRNPQFTRRLLAILARTGLPPQRLELEIAETAFTEGGGISQAVLRSLRAAGISIALDDFGTGYSVLNQLRRFEVDRIKIDSSIVKGIQSTTEGEAVVQAIIDLAHASGLKVTAEGVETEEQRDFLAGAQCNDMQGFLLSKPISKTRADQVFGGSAPAAAAQAEGSVAA
jgi:diguanylate cyclase (GGDEF)-like protein